MKKALLCMAILALAGIGFWLWFMWPQRQHRLVEIPPNVRWLGVGLSLEDQDRWHDISEGSEMLPLSFLEALKCRAPGARFWKAWPMRLSGRKQDRTSCRWAGRLNGAP